MNDDAPTASTPSPGQPPPPDAASGAAPPPGAIVSDPPSSTATVVAPPPPQTTTGTDGPDGPNVRGSHALGPQRPGLTGLTVALGVGLLAAAVVLSSSRSRDDGDLDWSNYGVSIGATAALLLVALVAALVAKDRGREELVTWPGAIGILGTGLVLGVGLEEVSDLEDVLGYLIGGVIVLLSVVGYLAVRRGAFAVTAILGLGIAYITLFDDVFSDIGDEEDFAIIVAAAIAVFVLAITAVGWLLRTRVLSSVVVGVIGVVAYGALLGSLAVVQVVGGFFSDFMRMDDGGIDPGMDPPFDGASAAPDFDNDVWVILGFALLLTLVWAFAAAVNGNSGFTVLAIAMPATTVPIATVVLAVEHPTWWGVALAGAGAVLLALGGIWQLRARRREAS